MTSNERKQIARCLMHLHPSVNNPDAAARGLSAIYRATRTARNQQYILAVAREYGLINNPDFRT